MGGHARLLRVRLRRLRRRLSRLLLLLLFGALGGRIPVPCFRRAQQFAGNGAQHQQRGEHADRVTLPAPVWLSRGGRGPGHCALHLYTTLRVSSGDCARTAAECEDPVRICAARLPPGDGCREGRTSASLVNNSSC